MASEDIPDFIESDEPIEFTDEIRAALAQSASGQNTQSPNLFRRRLDLKELSKLASSGRENWWADLLQLWRPSGQVDGNCLRLAIRDNTLNFYVAGQSVAQISVAKQRPPHASLHIKYVAEDHEARTIALSKEARGRCYPKLSETGFSHPKVVLNNLPYTPNKTMAEIVDRARHKSGCEKIFVEGMVANSPDVIDLEMGLPSLVPPTRGGDGVRRRGKDGGAPRIDLVALETSPCGPRVVFWEVKLSGDPRIVTGEKDRDPEVIGQLAKYETFLSDRSREKDVREGYATTCRLLKDLLDMAEAVDKQGRTLSPLVHQVANDPGSLTIDHKPRLLICTKGESRSSWPHHMKRLSQLLEGRCFEVGEACDLTSLRMASA